MKSSVKWFDTKKGYGFITVPGSNKEVFVHYSVIQGEGFKTLEEGEVVEFETEETTKGVRATKVTRINPPVARRQTATARS